MTNGNQLGKSDQLKHMKVQQATMLLDPVRTSTACELQSHVLQLDVC